MRERGLSDAGSFDVELFSVQGKRGIRTSIYIYENLSAKGAAPAQNATRLTCQIRKLSRFVVFASKTSKIWKRFVQEMFYVCRASQYLRDRCEDAGIQFDVLFIYVGVIIILNRRSRLVRR